MRSYFKLYIFLFALTLNGCGLSLPEISLPDFDSEKELEITDSDYSKVLNESYTYNNRLRRWRSRAHII